MEIFIPNFDKRRERGDAEGRIPVVLLPDYDRHHPHVVATTLRQFYQTLETGRASFTLNDGRHIEAGPEVLDILVDCDGDALVYRVHSSDPFTHKSCNTPLVNGRDTRHFPVEGLLATVVIDVSSREVLMVAYANEEALARTIELGLATLWSTSRNRLWTKGLDKSGNTMKIDVTNQGILINPARTALVYRVTPSGPACHKETRSCMFRRVVGAQLLEEPVERLSGWESLVVGNADVHTTLRHFSS